MAYKWDIKTGEWFDNFNEAMQGNRACLDEIAPPPTLALAREIDGVRNARRRDVTYRGTKVGFDHGTYAPAYNLPEGVKEWPKAGTYSWIDYGHSAGTSPEKEYLDGLHLLESILGASEASREPLLGDRVQITMEDHFYTSQSGVVVDYRPQTREWLVEVHTKLPRKQGFRTHPDSRGRVWVRAYDVIIKEVSNAH